MSHVCPIVLEVEKHSLLIIATDSYDVQPVSVDSLITSAGERYDFVINADRGGQEKNFWIRIKAIGFCEELEIQQFAVLTYSHEPHFSLAFPEQSTRFPDYWTSFGTGPVRLK